MSASTNLVVLDKGETPFHPKLAKNMTSRMMRGFFTTIAFIITIVVIAVEAQTAVPEENSPKEVVEHFCKLDAAGTQLTSEGQRKAAILFYDRKPWAERPEIVVVKNYVVRTLGIRGDTAQVIVEYNVWGRLDSSFRFARVARLSENHPIQTREYIPMIRSDTNTANSESMEDGRKCKTFFSGGLKRFRLRRTSVQLLQCVTSKKWAKDPGIRSSGENATNPSLLKAGDSVIPGDPAADPNFPKPYFVRVHNVSDVATQLTSNNGITGQVMFFMHGGTSKRTGESALFPYQPPKGVVSVPNSVLVSLVSYDNLAVFKGVQLAPKATITLYACHGGRKGKNPADPQNPISIAQELANTLNVTVYAWRAGMFFDVNPSTTATKPCANPPSPAPRTCPTFLPSQALYMLPWGGAKVPPCRYTPGGAEPENCGGNPNSPPGSQ